MVNGQSLYSPCILRSGWPDGRMIEIDRQRGKNILKEAPPDQYSLGARRDSEVRRFLHSQSRSWLSTWPIFEQSTERPFVFGSLSKTSQDSVASTSETLFKSLGTIELRYRRIRKCKARNSDVKGEFDTPEPTTVHEDSKLACLAHQGRQVWAFTTIVV